MGTRAGEQLKKAARKVIPKKAAKKSWKKAARKALHKKAKKKFEGCAGLLWEA